MFRWEMACKTSRVEESSDSSSSDDCNYYSGQAKRFKLAKQALFPSGMVKLVDNPKPSQSQEPESTGLCYDSDSSSEIIFQNIQRKQTENETERDLNESQVSTRKQVETLEDIEEYIDLSPDISLVGQENVSSPTRQSPIPILVGDSDDDDVLPASPVSSEVELVSTIKCSNIQRLIFCFRTQDVWI